MVWGMGIIVFNAILPSRFGGIQLFKLKVPGRLQIRSPKLRNAKMLWFVYFGYFTSNFLLGLAGMPGLILFVMRLQRCQQAVLVHKMLV
ncbi:MAG: hypothetical protein Ct9H90mP20_6490 [Candidatus Neomarinimicrobiota bacterium]|nr:MAG: hypothetical protein Ct9H90mP20_6490 [Candidatus Neomarinimicrobiota bacterium]